MALICKRMCYKFKENTQRIVAKLAAVIVAVASPLLQFPRSGINCFWLISMGYSSTTWLKSIHVGDKLKSNIDLLFLRFSITEIQLLGFTLPLRFWIEERFPTKFTRRRVLIYTPFIRYRELLVSFPWPGQEAKQNSTPEMEVEAKRYQRRQTKGRTFDLVIEILLQIICIEAIVLEM